MPYGELADGRFTLAATAALDRLPSDAHVPGLEIVVSGAASKRVAFDLTKRDGRFLSAALDVSAVGRYAVEIAYGSRVYWSQRFDIRRRRCFGKPATVELARATVGLFAPNEEPYADGDHEVVVGTRWRDPSEDDESADSYELTELDERRHDVVTFNWTHPWNADGVGTVLVVWRHGDKVIRTDSVDIDAAPIKDGGCPIAADTSPASPEASEMSF